MYYSVSSGLLRAGLSLLPSAKSSGVIQFCACKLTQFSTSWGSSHHVDQAFIKIHQAFLEFMKFAWLSRAATIQMCVYV